MLQTVQAHPSLEQWRRFLSLLWCSFIWCAVPNTPSPDSFIVLIDVSKLWWGVVLLVGHRIVRCAHDLWSTSFRQHVSNELELEALCRALRVFRQWVFGAPIYAIMDK